jgi:hypothetical protein
MRVAAVILKATMIRSVDTADVSWSFVLNSSCESQNVIHEIITSSKSGTMNL